MRYSDPQPALQTGARSNAVDPSFGGAVSDSAVSDQLLACASECFLVIDDESRIVFANPATESVFGHDPDAVVGESLAELLPERLHRDHFEGFRSYLRTGERSVDWDGIELPGEHRDGHEMLLLVSFREFDHDGERYFAGIVRDVSSQAEQRDRLATERAFVESIFDALPDIVYAFDRSGQFLRWNERANEVTGYTDEEIRSLDPLDVIAEEDHEKLATSAERVLTEGAVETVESRLVTKDGTEIPYEFTGAPLVEDGEIIGETGMGRDITERKRREELLERLDDLNTVIRSVDRALVEETTREDIARAVCDRLVDQGTYCGAIIGSVDENGDRFEVDASAGLGRAVREPVTVSTGGDGIGAAGEAAESRSVRLVDSVPDEVFRGDEAPVDDIDELTVAAVPLVVDDRLFGLLSVCTGREPGIPERERTVLEELGETIGNAMQSALTHQLLYSNTVTEIELRSTDSDVSFVALSERTDCRLTLDRAVSFGDEYVFYFTATGASPERIRESATEIDSIAAVDYLGGSERDRFEFRVVGGTMTTVLTELGARTVDGYADSGEAHVIAELPSDADVREVVDAVRSTYPETELLARRVAERSLKTPDEFRRGLAADLTEKQQAALEAAYFAGYFEWPARASDAGAVAETLDIAPQTFHQHLRVAERKLLAALFESG